METPFYLLVSFIIGAAIAWFISTLLSKIKQQGTATSPDQELLKKIDTLEKESIQYKATTSGQLKSLSETIAQKQQDILSLKESLEKSTSEKAALNHQLSVTTTQLTTENKALDEKNNELQSLKAALKSMESMVGEAREAVVLAASKKDAAETRAADLKTALDQTKSDFNTQSNTLSETNQALATARAQEQAIAQRADDLVKELKELKDELEKVKHKYNDCNEELATAKAKNEALQLQIETQKRSMEELGIKFNTEFENIANKILETKTEKFTELNKVNLTAILEPLGQNITEFKKQVDEVYKTESKERFSLGQEVKRLAELNQVISQEARNLTQALKGEAKTQGRWGEMILESILERSGLVKDREYFMEHELLDENGKPIRSEAEGKKMRPDAVIKYPDNRSVIIDSKVSLNAFTRLLATNDYDEQRQELKAHVDAIKNHIIALSTKGYDDYNQALDFVMLFIPSEPAYIAALQGDNDLWNFAYEKRILLINPTNLITCLKIILDLWKREYQNQNAQEIAERGAKLYDKFVGFVTNLQAVGASIDKARDSYSKAYGQLSEGSDNLVRQAIKLKSLGLKTKKELSQDIANAASSMLEPSND